RRRTSRGARRGKTPGPTDGLEGRGEAGEPPPRRRREHRRPADPVVSHRGDRVLDVGLPVAVSEVHRQLRTALGQLGTDLLDQLTIGPVYRRHATEMQVVLRDG